MSGNEQNGKKQKCISRRDFVKTVGAGTAVAALALSLGDGKSNPFAAKPAMAAASSAPTQFPITNEFFQEEAKTLEHAKRVLVLANRILANERVFDAYGHVSIRNPENPNTFLISRALSPEFVTLDDILVVDFDGKTVGGDLTQRPFSERFIHCAIYKMRPDVLSVAHPHPFEIIPFASSKLELRSVYHQDVTFYDGIPVFDDIPPSTGLLINRMDVAENLAKMLGNKRGIMIQNHGVVTVGESIPRVVYSSITMRDNARILLDTLAMGVEPHYIDRETAMYGTQVQLGGQGLLRSWNYWCTKAKNAYSDIKGLEHLK